MRIELSIPMTIAEIANNTDGIILGNNKQIVTHIVTDSREVKEGDLFIALRGKRFNGESYSTEAISRGAALMSSHRENCGIFVSDTQNALLRLAAYYTTKLPYIKYKVAITGSVGKTTTKEFLKVLLNERYVTHASEGNLNNEIGMPLSILSAPLNTEVLVCELGMNHEGEISRMSKSLAPNIAVITNVGTSHIGNLGSRQNIAKAKLEVLDGMRDGRLLVPKEEPLLSEVNTALTFSLGDCNADFSVLSAEGGNVSLYKKGTKILTQKFAFPEEHLLSCLAAAFSAAMLCGVTKEELNRGILHISRDNIRQKIVNKGEMYFYQDCYNASLESVYAAFKSVAALTSYTARSAVLGDILELGDHSDEIHRKIGKELVGFGFNKIYLFGKLVESLSDSAIECGFPKERIFLNHDINRPDITASQIKENFQTGEIILLKASRSIRLERVLDFFDDYSDT